MSESPAKAWLRRPLVLGIVVALVGAIVFAPAIFGGWVYDDHQLIPDNPFIHSFESWPRWFLTDFWNVNEEMVRFGSRIIYWRPAITMTYAVDWQVGDGSPWVFHITNTLAQAAVGALAFVVLRRWVGAVIPACLAALIFVVHPTKAESVAWIAGRTDVLCMLAILVATQGAAMRLQGRRGGLFVEVFGTAAAYMCKEQAIVLPAFIAVEAWVAAGRPAIDLRSLRSIVVRALPQALVAIAYIGVRSVLLPIRAANVETTIGLVDHAQAILETIGRFVVLTIAPHHLSIQQGLVHFADGQAVHSGPYMLVGAVASVALVLSMILARRRWPFITVGIAFYLFTLAPTSNIVYTDMRTLVSERFLYLPVFGVAFIVGCALNRATSKWPYVVAVAAILAMSFQAVQRAADYRDERRFWDRELELHPDSTIALQYQVNEALGARQNQRALVLLLGMTKTRVGYQDAEVAVQLAEILSLLVPDREVDGLRKLDAYVAELLDPAASEASISLRGVTFAIPTQNRLFQGKFRSMRPRALAARADIHSRLGDDVGAVAIAERELEDCPRCVSVVMMTALARARSGDYEGSLSVLDHAGQVVGGELFPTIRRMVDKGREAHQQYLAAPPGPRKLQARASELAALELWGRAYDVLAPYKAEILKAPNVAMGFAELAFRAGDRDTAREVLAAIVSPAQVDSQLTAWSRTMGWEP